MATRAYKYRFYPSREQAAMLNRWFGCARWTWNQCLSARSKAYRRRGDSMTGTDFSRIVTTLKKGKSTDWLAEPPATVLVQKLRDQDRSFQNFFAGRAKYPKFKKRAHRQSIRLQLDQRQVHRMFDAETGLLKLPKIGQLKVRWTNRRPAGIPKMVTVSRDPAGRWFVSMAVDEHIPKQETVGRTVGLDLGIAHLVVPSKGDPVGNLRLLAGRLKQLGRAQRSLSRRRKGSGRWHRQRHKVARLHARVADTREDLLHKVSRKIVDENQVIAIEGLNVKGMIKHPKLAQAISDVAWGELVRMLKYKAEWAGRTLIVVDRWFASSKTCSCCGSVKEKLPLSNRSWTCGACQTRHDRDRNAAINIEAEGLKSLLPGGTGEFTHGEMGGCSPNGQCPSMNRELALEVAH